VRTTQDWEHKKFTFVIACCFLLKHQVSITKRAGRGEGTKWVSRQKLETKRERENHPSVDDE